jgi:uncharacterized membrane protein
VPPEEPAAAPPEEPADSVELPGIIDNTTTPAPAAATPPPPPQEEPTPAAPTSRRWWQAENRARLAALLAPLFVVLLGNLAQALWFVDGYAAQNEGRPEWAYWDATRLVEGTVNEFPFFTFLFADLHAHMMVMPLSLAVLGLLVALVRRRTLALLPLLPIFGLLALLAGALRATNTWDYPTFVGLTAATLALLGWQGYRRARRRLVPDISTERLLLAAHWLGGTVGLVALLVLLGNLFFAPFISHFATESSGVDLLREGLRADPLEQLFFAQRTALWDTLRMYGLWLFVLVSAGALLAWRHATLPEPHENEVALFLGGLLAGAALMWLLSRLQAELEHGLPGLVLLVPLLLAALWLA